MSNLMPIFKNQESQNKYCKGKQSSLITRFILKKEE